MKDLGKILTRISDNLGKILARLASMARLNNLSKILVIFWQDLAKISVLPRPCHDLPRSCKILQNLAKIFNLGLFELKQRIELGCLTQQEGTITCLSFCNNSHMLSGSEDGTICVWECKSWDCLKVLKGHREAVTSISVHPTGRLALSVSTDKSLRTWNLLTGRSAYVTNIKQVANIVLWSPSGETYAVATRTQVIVYKVSTAALVYTIECTKTVLAMTFIDDNVLATGGEMQDIEIHDIQSERNVQSITGHETRIKGLASVKHHDDTSDVTGVLLFSVSSDGVLKAWRFQNGKYDDKPDLLCQFELNCRPTCITVFPGKSKSKDVVQVTPKNETEIESRKKIRSKGKAERKQTKTAGSVDSTEQGKLKSKKRKRPKSTESK
ncbi:p21-activated kinase-interacting 1-like [Paramuricea clavata]|uniref:P21-activated kinase-interacting 1-like n=1 Tax=Paramuricea clavata TaxID=317549 RepID=A0A6S7GTP7_PARCT|nr:p21-activated kinase-interacting 1-like [Paramuricea clavata]